MLKWKKCDAMPMTSAFSPNVMTFYMSGRLGLWKATPTFPVHVTVSTERSNGKQKVFLNLTIKPPLVFHITISIAAVSFLWVVGYSFMNEVSPIFFVLPLLFAGSSILENSWQQDACLDKLERIIEDKDMKTRGR